MFFLTIENGGRKINFSLPPLLSGSPRSRRTSWGDFEKALNFQIKSNIIHYGNKKSDSPYLMDNTDV